MVCSDATHPEWESGWKNFFCKYKPYIVNVVKKYCTGYRTSRLGMQFEDFLNDIVQQIFLELVKDDAKCLRDCQGFKDEVRFLGWLKLLSKRVSCRYLGRQSVKKFGTDKFSDFSFFTEDTSEYQKREFYECVVKIIRSLETIKPYKMERNVHIFMMSMLGEFSENMICELSYFSHLGPRTVAYVISRIKKLLKQKKFSNL